MINKLISWGLRVFLVLACGGAKAAHCTISGSYCYSSNVMNETANLNCVDQGTECIEVGNNYTTWAKRSCISCNAGGHWKLQLFTITGFRYDCDESFTFYDCVCDYSQCTNGAWKTLPNSSISGVDVQAYCASGDCATRYQYTCTTGYYGIVTGNTLYQAPGVDGSCTTCPPYYAPGTTGAIAGKSSRGSDRITDCYISAGTKFEDAAGLGHYATDCYYKN